MTFIYLAIAQTGYLGGHARCCLTTSKDSSTAAAKQRSQWHPALPDGPISISELAGFLPIQLTGANRNDSQQALSVVDAIPSLQGERGRPRQRPDGVLGDRGYDAESIRQGLGDRGIIPFLAKRNTEHGSGLGRWRWVVERTFAWSNQLRRLRVRYEKRADIHKAFSSLGCALICWRFLRSDWATG